MMQHAKTRLFSLKQDSELYYSTSVCICLSFDSFPKNIIPIQIT